MRMRWALVPASVLLLAGCASPGDVEVARQNGYAMASGAHDKIINDTNADYANHMPTAQEWDVHSIFNLPASGALAVLITALCVAAICVVAYFTYRYHNNEDRRRQEANQEEARGRVRREEREHEQRIADTLARGTTCPCCQATPADQLGVRKRNSEIEEAAWTSKGKV